jgi:hypothetical protein
MGARMTPDAASLFMTVLLTSSFVAALLTFRSKLLLVCARFSSIAAMHAVSIKPAQTLFPSIPQALICSGAADRSAAIPHRHAGAQ